MHTQQGGYISLIILLISIAVIALLFTCLYLTPEPVLQGDDSLVASSSAPAQTKLEQYQHDIDSAKAVQGMLDADTQHLNTPEAN